MGELGGCSNVSDASINLIHWILTLIRLFFHWIFFIFILSFYVFIRWWMDDEVAHQKIRAEITQQRSPAGPDPGSMQFSHCLKTLGHQGTLKQFFSPPRIASSVVWNIKHRCTQWICHILLNEKRILHKTGLHSKSPVISTNTHMLHWHSFKNQKKKKKSPASGQCKTHF